MTYAYKVEYLRILLIGGNKLPSSSSAVVKADDMTEVIEKINKFCGSDNESPRISKIERIDAFDYLLD